MLTIADISRQERAERKFVRAKHIYIDMAGGDLIAGIILSEVAYWSLVPKKTGESRLRRVRESKGKDHLWLACPRSSWWERSRLTIRQLDRGMKHLEKLGLVKVEHFDFRGQSTLHVRLIDDAFTNAYNACMEADCSTPMKRKPRGKSAPKLVEGVSLIREGVSLIRDTDLLIREGVSLNGEALDLIVPIVPSSSNPNGCAAPPAAADDLSPIGEFLDLDQDPALADFFADATPAAVIAPEPNPVPEMPAPPVEVKAETPKVVAPDYADRVLMQAAVRYYFDMKREPSRSSDWSHINKMVNFFRGSLKGKDEWANNQPSDGPLNALEVIGLRLWFCRKFEEDVTVPSKPATIANYIPQFRMSEEYDQACKAAIKRLSAMVPAEAMPAEPEKPRYPKSKLEQWGELPSEDAPENPPIPMLEGESFNDWKLRMYAHIAAGMGVDMNGRPLDMAPKQSAQGGM